LNLPLRSKRFPPNNRPKDVSRIGYDVDSHLHSSTHQFATHIQPRRNSRTMSTTSNSVPADKLDLLSSTASASVATIGPNGEPQVNPVWFSWDGVHVRFGVSMHHQKYRNLLKIPRISVSIVDPANPYRCLEIRGAAIRFEPDTDSTFVNSLVNKYMGREEFPYPSGEHVPVVVNHSMSLIWASGLRTGCPIIARQCSDRAELVQRWRSPSDKLVDSALRALSSESHPDENPGHSAPGSLFPCEFRRFRWNICPEFRICAELTISRKSNSQ